MLFVLAGAAVFLTWAMFQTRQSMLGFPCMMFWAILGGYCYQQSTATWDMYYFTFFGCMGMAIFCAFAAYGLRTKKEEMAEGDEFIDEGKDDLKFIDEGSNSNNDKADRDVIENMDDMDKPRRRSRDIRDRANKRRSRFE